MGFMKILITGATGLIGTKLLLRLFQEGHDLVILSRDAQKAKETLVVPAEVVQCNLMTEIPSASIFTGVEAVIHLAGESVAGGRWNQKLKTKIQESRKLGTQNLIQGFQSLGTKGPKLFICASAIGFYGDSGDSELTEHSAAGNGFLAQVCKEWESQAQSAATEFRRVALLRLGVVLARNGGALASMAAPFSMGMGAQLGSGKQWMSWIHIDDAVNSICFILGNPKATGPINLVSPQPVTHQEFTQTLAAAFGKKAHFKLPPATTRWLLGEMAETVLSSARVQPLQLKSLGFHFHYPDLQSALSQIYQGYPDQIFEAFQFIQKPLAEVFQFFEDPKNLETITPPWLHFKILSQSTPKVQTGTQIQYRLKVHGVPTRWESKIHEWKHNESFADEQLKGPYAKWYHIHRFQSLRGGTLAQDRVAYRLPLGGLGQWVAGNFVKGDVQKIFAFRRKRIIELFPK